jgi:hypothetical protein
MLNKTILFASGDIGGAKAIIPIIDYVKDSILNFYVLNNGYLSKEGYNNNYNYVSGFPPKLNSHPDVYIFSSSLRDKKALALARYYKKHKTKVIHVLDSWSNYSKRLKIDGLPLFEPDYYTVMDKLSYDAAIKDGINKDLLIITGHTGYANMTQNSYPEININLKKDLDLNKKIILFVSEPVSSDQPKKNQENFRGYTEKEVANILCKSLDKYSDQIQLLIAPHPRDDIKLVNDLFYRNKRSLDIKILQKNNLSLIINHVSGVVGMASVALYESWLLGIPTISIQPNLKDKSLRSFNKRNGLIFIDSYSLIDKSIEKFMFKILEGERSPQIELMKQNRMSIKKVVKLFL